MISKQDEITNFSLHIEKLVRTKRVSYMDAILLYCEQNNVEIEVTAKLISGAIRAKLKVEAEDLNFLPKTNTNKLPV